MNPSVVTLTRHKRISRWAMHWLQYDIEFHHIPGTRNGRADVLSRGLAAPNGGVLRMPSDYILVASVRRPPSQGSRPHAVNLVAIAPDAAAASRQTKYMTDVDRVMTSRSPWPSRKDFIAVQNGATDEFKTRLQRDASGKLFMVGSSKPKPAVPVWKQLCELQPGAGRYVIDFFCGIGGAAMGVEIAGGKVHGAFDNNKTALKSYALNCTDADVVNIDMWRSEAVITRVKQILLTHGIDEWDMWFSASCQPFSNANRDPRKATDKRRQWPIHVANIVKRLRDDNAHPTVIFSENLSNAGASAEWREGIEIITNASYTVHEATINAMHTGTCCNRRRWFCVFVDNDSNATCLLPQISDILSRTTPLTLGDELPHRDVTYYNCAFNNGNHLFGKGDQIPGPRRNSWHYDPTYEANARERSKGYSIDRTKPPTRADFRRIMGYPATATLPDDDDAFMLALAQSVVPNTAATVYASVQHSGTATSDLVCKLAIDGMDNEHGDVFFIPRGDQCRNAASKQRSEDMIRTLVAVAHQGVAGHRPPDVTLKALKQLFHFTDMSKTVKHMVGDCLQCIKNRRGEWVTRPMGSAVLGERPNEVLHIDFFWIGPEYQLTIKDSLTSYCRLCATTDCKARTAATHLMQWFADYGPCEWIVSDGGPHFKNRILKTITDLMGINHHINTAYIHQAAGTVEVLQQRTKALLRKLCGELTWPFEDAAQLLPAVQLSVNHTPNSRGDIPARSFHGMTAKMPLQMVAMRGGPDITHVQVDAVSEHLDGKLAQHTKKVRTALDMLHRRLIDTTVRSRRNDRRRSAKSKARGKDVYMPRVQPGDLVLVSTPDTRRHKLEFNWKGPWVVIGPTDSDVWVLSSHGTDDNDEYNFPAFADESTHVYDVHLLGDSEHTKRVHVSNMIAFSAAKANTPSQTTQRLREAARHDLQRGFAVDGIIGHSTSNGELRLRVQWMGFTEHNSTLEPLENLRGCEADVMEYCRLHQDEHALIAEHYDALRESRTSARARTAAKRAATRERNRAN